MLKKALAIFSCVIILATVFSMPFNASAKSYKQQLLDSGFPESYVDDLAALHDKYPNWNFIAFKTGLDWQTAINGERSPHKQQALYKTSDLGAEWFCSCDSCKTPAEGSKWYSASESAVKYYMDPRNSLSEEYIFQFESTAYETTQTQNGVEAIISSTWMNNANITYNSTENKTVTYKNSSGNSVKYSAAIIDAAKKSGMSAYYLASKIVQEVGSKTASYAGGSCGTRKPFYGIYNYYNIGANTGAMDGLAWAAGYLRTNKQTKLYDYDEQLKDFVVRLDSEGNEVVLKSEQYLSYINKNGSYIQGMLYNDKDNSTDETKGYVLEDDLRTTYFTYCRPWTDPYKTIYYGAQYIAKGYSQYQFTGYLQKFNVNKDSGRLYEHEYMINLAGAKSEAKISYKAYKDNNLLTQPKTFYIPVFNNMPEKNCEITDESEENAVETVKDLTVKSKTDTTVTLTWTPAQNVQGYNIYEYNSSTKEYKKLLTVEDGNASSAKVSSLKSAAKHSFAISAYIKADEKVQEGKKSAAVSVTTKPLKVTLKTVTSPKSTKIKTVWKAATGGESGYQIYYSRDKAFKKIVAKKFITPKKTSYYTGKNFTKGVKYYIKVRSYKTVDGKKQYGSWSSIKAVKCK